MLCLYCNLSKLMKYSRRSDILLINISAVQPLETVEGLHYIGTVSVHLLNSASVE